jgi:hypothetical protein
MREHTLAQLLTDMPDAELRAARHDAVVGLSLLLPASPMHGPAQAYLGLLEAELARRHAAAAARTAARTRAAPGERTS